MVHLDERDWWKQVCTGVYICKSIVNYLRCGILHMKIVTGNSDQSWECWYKEEIQYLRGLTTSWKVFLMITRCMMWVVMGIGIAGPGIPN